MVDNGNLQDLRRTLFRMGRGKIFYSFFPLKRTIDQNPANFEEMNSLEEILESPIEKFIESEAVLGESTKFGLKQDVVLELLDEGEHKSGFLIMLPGPVREFLSPRVARLLSSSDARVFDFPSSGDKMTQQLELMQEEVTCCLQIYSNSMMALQTSSSSLNTPPMSRQTVPSFLVLKSELLTAKFYLDSLNQLVQNRSLLHGLFWVPAEQVDTLKLGIQNFNKKRNCSVLRISEEDPSVLNLIPPTSFHASSFLHQFQEIVNTYGVPKYREINPAVFTAVTFPFLFGLMFGDIAHGSVLLVFALFLLCKSESISLGLNTSRINIKSLGITLTLMGVFSVYVGGVYNDFLALPLTFFPSCYSPAFGRTDLEKTDPSCQWAFGIDFAWHESANSVGFLNSFKMKTSIIIGVVHMTLGIFLKGANCCYFRDWSKFFFVFLPELLFFLCTFGYMVLLIIIKWLTVFPSPEEAPSIISIFINFITQ